LQQDIMSWSFPIARLFGINVYVHATFFLLLAFFGWAGIPAKRQELSAALNSMLLVILLFGIIVMHELGHALMARRFGVGTRDITLLPIGGVARLERIPENPYQEFAIAVAGPAVNVVLAIVCLRLLFGARAFRPESAFDLTSPNLANWLISVNVMLVLFNMIPAFRWTAAACCDRCWQWAWTTCGRRKLPPRWAS
jgi:Zn-dependent protease